MKRDNTNRKPIESTEAYWTGRILTVTRQAICEAMRSWSIAIVLIIAAPMFLISATGKTFQWVVKTDTGTTGIHLTNISEEIYVVSTSTQQAFIHWTSSSAVTSSNFLLQRTSTSTSPAEHTEEVRSSYMSVTQSTGPVNIRIQIKSSK